MSQQANAAPSAIVIDVRGLTRTYQVGDTEVHALDGVDLIVPRGQFVAIMGSSGSGKSTLMAVLGCLDRPSSGQYLFEGTDVAMLTEPELARIRSAKIGFVFQSFNLLARTSAIENVALPLFYAPDTAIDKARRLSRARAALALLGLAAREANTPAQLSGGQQQRVAIARALINLPSVVLADEPTGNLDTRTSHEIMETLVRLNEEQGVTIIVVTHERDIAAYTQRVITMRDGRVVTDELNPPRAATIEAGAARDSGGKELFDAAAKRPADASAGAAAGPAWALAEMIVAAALQALLRNKTRSALTMLGVFIGVAALIAMVAVGQGANEAVRKQIASLGTNLFVVVPGASTSGGVRSGFGSASTLTVADADAIRREARSVASVSYLIRQSGQVQHADRNWTTGIQGVTASYPGITNWRIALGRGITDEDERGTALVAVIGETVRRQLFSDFESPLGSPILVRGIPLRVVGVYEPKGQTAWGQDQDDLVMVPFSPPETKVVGVAAPAPRPAAATPYPQAPNPFGVQPRLTGYVNQIYVQAVAPLQVKDAIDEVTATLNRRHRIKPGATPDFNVRNLSQIADAAEGSSKIMASLLAVVASISLLVGGIGIMNILLVSVTERTREIGLRMAIGAQRRHVLLQFLAEAVFLSLVGGVAGIVAGVAVTEMISLVAKWPTFISATAIGAGFAFSAAVGIFFGYYPARKAARLNPIEALRYE
ncbi:ABC transporter permease [Massilia sp. R2A-15]|uniref:ABC transporter permease n=1 Tax=Massilia sp. R2A-15 TaxID=3064278 RepID=UPI002732AE0D|nr:ABC transporter permease [Massilia sp. R2A-15]WLI90717.1 ABC transporter permease [Massilia sp. R2A-15]